MVEAAIEHLLDAPGKQLRPLLVHLAASLGDPPPGAVRDVAVAAELIHLASLVHDDILDGASHRRGRPALHVLRGQGVATLVGDFLFSRAFDLLARHARLGVVSTMARAITCMCEAELDQRARRGDLGITAAEYLEQCRKKSGALMAASALAGGQVARLPGRWQECLYQYGLCLGSAFQIIDDLLDITGDAASLGKPVRQDLGRGVITLPVIWALADPYFGPQLRQVLCSVDGQGDDRWEDAYRLVVMSTGWGRATGATMGLLGEARLHLEELPPTPAREALEGLIERLAGTLPARPAISPSCTGQSPPSCR